MAVDGWRGGARAPEDGQRALRDASERTHEVHATPVFHARRRSTRVQRSKNEHAHSALAGAISGIACALCVAPLDVVKARKQVQAVQKGGRRYGGTLESLRLIHRQEGFAGFFRGLKPTIMGYVPSWSIYFSCYGGFKDALLRRYGKQNAMFCTIGGAVGAGTITNLFTNPFWVVRTRLQVQDHVLCKRPEYLGTADAFRKIYQQEGFFAFYKGLGASLLGLSHVAIQFPLYEGLKKRLEPRFGAEDDSWRRVGVLVMASTVSKVVATIVTYPHDIARARLHIEHSVPTDKAPVTGRSPLLRVPVFRMINSIVQREGFLGLYQGLGTQLLRVSPASAITLTSYEFLFAYLNA